MDSFSKFLSWRSEYPFLSVVKCNLEPIFSLFPINWWSLEARNFFQTSSAKNFSETIPHITQCFLILGLATERYMLVCHPAKAKIFYHGKFRYGFFSLITAMILLTCILPVGDLVYHLIVYSGYKSVANLVQWNPQFVNLPIKPF